MSPAESVDQPTEVTLLLRRASRGETGAFDRLFPNRAWTLAETWLRREAGPSPAG